MKLRFLILLILVFFRVLFGQTQTKGPDQARELSSFREKLIDGGLRHLPSPEAELILGVVMGYKSSLPKDFYNSLVRSGTVHIVVASGYNVMIVASMALSVTLLFLKRRLASLIAIVIVWFYVILSGGEVSLIRAALMGGVALVGLAWGRGSKISWSLYLTAGTMLIVSPSLVTNVGFQLSVAATFGVAAVGPLLKKSYGRGDPIDLTTTLGAFLMTAPLIWWHFGRVSWIALISNIFVLPLISLVMFFGGLMLFLEIIFSPLATLVSWPTYALAHLVVVLINFWGR